MKCLILIVLCSMFLRVSSFGGMSEINVELYKDGGDLQCRVLYEAIVIRDRPFKVYVNTKKYKHPIYHAWCFIGEQQIIVPFIQEEMLDRLVSKPNTIDNKNTSCTCIFHTKQCSKFTGKFECIWVDRRRAQHTSDGVKCDFPVIVKNQYQIGVPDGLMYVNGIHVAEDPYRYQEGTQAMFSCRKNAEGYIRMIYTPQGAEPILTGYQSTDTLDWYLKLTPDNHNGSLQCEIADVAMGDLKVIRVRLENIAIVPKPVLATRDLQVFEVNGLILSPEYTLLIQNYHYEYDFYDGEHLTINIIKHESFKKLSCTFTGPKGEKLPYKIPEYKVYTYEVNFVEKLAYSVLTCSVNSEYNSTQEFILTFFHENSYISGLSYANILMSYVMENTTNSYKTMIVYDYNTNSKLTCKQGYWTYGATHEIKCPEDDQHRGRAQNCTFMIATKQNTATVTCSSYDVRLVGKKQVPPAPATVTILATTTYIVSTNTAATTPYVASTSIAATTPYVASTSIAATTPYVANTSTAATTSYVASTPTTPKKLAIVGALVFVVTLIAIIILLHLYKRRQSQRGQVLMDYSTLPEHDEGPMATPSQWNEERTDLYAKPIPKSQRNKNQSTSNTNNEPTYLEPSYAVVGNKEELNYANLDIPINSKDNYVNVRSPYAEVLPQTSACTVGNSNYVNVNNAKMNEEPAYCEVNTYGK